MAFTILFTTLTVVSQQNSSATAVGENLQNDWTSHGKQNTCIGQLNGVSNAAISPLVNVLDNDVYDSPIFDNDLNPVGQAQTL
jgi:hypothetical protein